jgi:Ca2+/Na+ antiporter
MELDDFKQRFKEREEPGQMAFHSAHELEGYTRKRTHSIVNNIKRSIFFELLACIIFTATAVWVWFSYPVSYVRVFCLLAVCLCVFLLIYLAALYKKINVYEKAPLAVKNRLQQVITILEQFTRAYFQFTMITLPVAFIFGLITGFLTVHNDTGFKNFNWQKAVLLYTGWFIFWSAIMYFFSKWYINKLYGKYLQQLKGQLKDIENG